MSTRARRWLRFVASLMCALHLGSALGVAAGSGQSGARGNFAAAGYACGHVSAAMLATLADTVPGVFAEAWRQLTGSGEECCGFCSDGGPAVPRSAVIGFVVEPASHEASRLPPCRGAYRPEVLTPPATAPPAFS